MTDEAYCSVVHKATSAVLFNGSIGDWFGTTVGVRQGCLLSPTVFNIFLERIMTDALEDHEGTFSIGCRTVTNLRFADDIDGLVGEEEELAKLVECLDKASTAFSMEISAKKTRLMTNNTGGIKKEIKVNGQKLETVPSFRFLGSVITDEGSKPDILSRIAQTTAAWPTGSKQQLESDKDVYSHKITTHLSALEAEQSPISALLMTA